VFPLEKSHKGAVSRLVPNIVPLSGGDTDLGRPGRKWSYPRRARRDHERDADAGWRSSSRFKCLTTCMFPSEYRIVNLTTRQGLVATRRVPDGEDTRGVITFSLNRT
jgi:hypothetical protein